MSKILEPVSAGEPVQKNGGNGTAASLTRHSISEGNWLIAGQMALRESEGKRCAVGAGPA